MRSLSVQIVAGFALRVCISTSHAQTPQADLAAQVRIQGFACDKPLGATRDKKLSRPDYAVWTLKCSNAVYRVGRFPDMSAKIVPLR